MILQWLGSYLVGREQFVGIASCHSRTVKLFSSVLQGSVLGPLLFSILTTPVGNLIMVLPIRRRHTAINITSPTELATLASCVDAITGWHIRIDLLLNPTKIEAIVTGMRQQIAKFDQSVRITIFGAAIPFGSTLRVIEVTLDSEFTFHEHITVVVCECNFHLCTLRQYLIDREAANTIACSIVILV